ncbi:MAG: immunoglobulin-like domain-containing protein [Bacillota bacterium]
MLRVIFLLVMLMCLAYIFFRYNKHYLKETAKLDKKLYPLKAVLSIGLALIDISGYRFNTNYDLRVKKNLAELYGSGKAEYMMKINTANKICTAILLVILILAFGTVSWLQEHSERAGKIVPVIIGNKVERPGFGMGDSILDARATLKSDGVSQSISYRIILKEQLPELDTDAVRKAYDLLSEDLIKGRNISLENTVYALNLKPSYERLKHLGVVIEWTSNDSRYIKADGNVSAPDKGQSPVKAILTASIKRGNAELNKQFVASIIPKSKSEKDLLIEKAKQELDRYLKTNINNIHEAKYLIFPSSLENLKGVMIDWENARKENGNTSAGMGAGYVVTVIAAVAAVFMLYDNEIKKSVEKRRREIQFELPAFLTKLVLLINAGLNVSNAWEKIAHEVSRDTPLHRELKKTIIEIRSGVPEILAYEHFAQRCATAETSKFISLLIQNLKKGNSELVNLLRILSRECWDNRKNIARRMGEEASTKLLLPMMLMLLGILIIVSTPALLSLRGF